MNTHHHRILVPGIFAAAALVLAVSASAQTPPPPAPSPAAPQTGPMTGHHKHNAAGAAGSKHAADMKAECLAMMDKKQEMQARLAAMDVALDKLVAEMNAAKGSKEIDAMEKPMAAVINELVAQRKASHSMMMEMQPAMMAHRTNHGEMHGTKGAMECPMMKMDHAHEGKAEEKKPKA
jgi:Skp family chaperone for outer membrane proteins